MLLIIHGYEIHDNKEIMDKLFRLRYDTFILNRNWALPSRDGMEIDQYDTNESIYFILLNEQKDIVASARITQTLKSSLLADLFPHLIETGESPRGSKLYEGTRFTLSPKLRSCAEARRARAEIGCSTVKWVLEHGGTQIQAVVDYSSFPNMVAMSMQTRPLGLPHEYAGGQGVSGGGKCIAFRWDLSSELIDDFQQYGGMIGRASRDTQVPCAVH